MQTYNFFLYLQIKKDKKDYLCRTKILIRDGEQVFIPIS